MLPAQLRWKLRRGMRELDVLLERFATRWDQLGDAERATFVSLLAVEDDQLWDLLSGRIKSADKDLQDIVDKIRAHN